MSDREMLSSKPPLPALYWYHEFLAWAAHPAENGYVPVHPDTLRTVAKILLEHHRRPVEPSVSFGTALAQHRKVIDRQHARIAELERATQPPSVNIAQRCLYENGDFACRLEAGHTTSHWLISKDRIADEVFDSSSVEIEEQNRRLAEQVSQLEAEIERLRAAEPPTAGYQCMVDGCPGNHASKREVCGSEANVAGNVALLEMRQALTEAIALLRRWRKRESDCIPAGAGGDYRLFSETGMKAGHWERTFSIGDHAPAVTKEARHWECDACKTVNHADRIVCVHCDAWGPVETTACQHDLLAPNPTVTVDPTDPFAAHCDACGYKWRTRPVDTSALRTQECIVKRCPQYPECRCGTDPL